MVKACLGYLVDTMFCVKWIAKLNIFIILVLCVSEFVVVVFLSEWWLGPTSTNHCGHISRSDKDSGFVLLQYCKFINLSTDNINVGIAINLA